MEKGRARSEDTGRAKRAVARRNMVAERGVARVSQGRREGVGACSLEEGLGSLGSRWDRNGLVPLCYIIFWA